MTRLYALLSLLLLVNTPALAQDVARGEIYGGYSYLSSQTNGVTPARQSYNGWESSFSMNLSKRFAAESDLSGFYQKLDVVGLGTSPTGTTISLRDYSIFAGPRVNFRRTFFHALFGLDRLAGSGTGFSSSQNKFGGAVGGGVEWNLSRFFALRTSADYVFTHHNIFGGPAALQNNLRATAGLVYRFGGRGTPDQVSRRRSEEPTQPEPASPRSEPSQSGLHTAAQPVAAQRVETQPAQVEAAQVKTVRPSRPRPAPRRVQAETSISALGILADTGEIGVQVIELTPGSVAENAGLHPGDVITGVDDQRVTNTAELASELSKRPPGASVRLVYMIKGYWHTETVVTLPR